MLKTNCCIDQIWIFLISSQLATPSHTPAQLQIFSQKMIYVLKFRFEVKYLQPARQELILWILISSINLPIIYLIFLKCSTFILSNLVTYNLEIIFNVQTIQDRPQNTERFTKFTIELVKYCVILLLPKF